MIKLNNKNITYVALADSNNSLKAPKEIWYADTNNSVKLVYRRKDALIEGEDYEKYHWLKVDGTARISTNETISSTDKVECVIKPTDTIETSNRWQYIYCNNGGDNDFTFMFVLDNPTSMYFRHYRAVSVYTPNDIYTIEHSINSVSVNGIQLGHISENQYVETDRKLGLFCAGDNPYVETTHIYTGYIGEFKLIDKLSLIPCKLLKPVPKWLDANGIRRQVGECGMIDLVSGKFYGNVNSVGTFTVENYYERKEWLVGDGSAYIDTLHLANEGLLWETHVSNLSFKKYFVWNRIVNIESPAIALYHSATFNGIVRVQNNYTNSIELQNQTDYDYIVATNSNGTVINGVQYIEQSASENISNKSIKLFYCDLSASTTQYVINNGGNSQDVRCAYFRFINNGSIVQNLIPCTLTMDLPASMDANNIARTKGTSGMWDLVSDRFYGNVANSGTFKAVNLAEGVDYEVHQWLRIDVNTMQYTRMMSLPVNSYQFSFRRKWLRQGTYYIHSSYFNVADYPYFTNQNIKLLIWDVANATCTYDSGTRFNLGDTITINCNAENYNFDEVSMPIYGVCNFIPFDCGVDDPSVGADIAFLTSSITVDGIERYIPVKLLKSIPSKYDANGIARQAGECGMYDTVNDKFYGNVASSGTFTVSD